VGWLNHLTGEIADIWRNLRCIHFGEIILPSPTAQDAEDRKQGSFYKDGRAFYGMDHWDPVDPEHLKTKESYGVPMRMYAVLRYQLLWFDIRRLYAIACGIAMLCLQTTLAC
jgi:hypothetical protein